MHIHGVGLRALCAVAYCTYRQRLLHIRRLGSRALLNKFHAIGYTVPRPAIKSRILDVAADVPLDADLDTSESAIPSVPEWGVNGTYELRFTKRGVFLKVIPPEGDGSPASQSDVYTELHKKRVRQVNPEGIARAFTTFNETFIAPPHTDEPIDETMTVEVEPDDMTAYVLFSEPDGGKRLGFGDFLNTLSIHGICHGVVRDLRALFDSRASGELIPIAYGTPMVSARDAYINYRFRRESRLSDAIMRIADIDYDGLDLIYPVKVGALLAKIVSPQEGLWGMNVYGVPIIPSAGKGISIPHGTGTKLSEDKQELYSMRDGCCTERDGAICVEELYALHRSIPPMGGDVHAAGNVLIEGNVAAGATIEAGGDVEITGVAEAATIIAGGHVMLRRGVAGMNKARIDAGGNVYARYIKSAEVQAGGCIYTDTLHLCTVNAGESVFACGRIGSIIGGTTRASKVISAQVIGSHNYTDTFIELGENFYYLNERDTLKQLVQTLEERLRILRNPYDSKGKLINEKLLRHRNENDRVVVKVKHELDEAQLKLIEVTKAVEHMPSGSVKAALVFPRVFINIAGALCEVEQNERNATYIKVGKSVIRT